MSHRRVTYRSATLRIAAQPWPFGAAAWEHETLRLLVQARWRPATDVAETTRSIEVTVDLAGVDEDDFEVQLFDNGLVVEGRRHLPSCGEDAVYHAAGIPQGFFRLELPLPARIDPERVEARYERGLLHVTLPKRS
jgi:HSP20 family protein